MLLDVRALLDPPSHVAGPVQIHTWGRQKLKVSPQHELSKLGYCILFICLNHRDRPGLVPVSVSFAQENSEEISLDISLSASSKSLPSGHVTTGINSEAGGGESSSFDWPKTEPVEPRCTPL